MRKIKIRKLVKKIIGIVCAITMCITNSERIYAMETLREQIAGRIESANAREFEMNIVLEDLCIKRWKRRAYAPDEWKEGEVMDVPLGEYSEEKLKEYTEEDFRVEFEYCCGYYGVGREPRLIQIERIYKDGELYIFTYNVWFGYAVDDVIEDGRFYCLDLDDYKKRMEKFYESME